MKLSDWVEDFDGTLARVLAHIDLPPDPNVRRFYEGDRPRAHGQLRPGAPAGECARPRPLEGLCHELAPLIGELENAGLIAPDQAKIADRSAGSPELSLWKPAEPATALGLAVEFLMKEPVFARLPFGDWSQVLIGQINRDQFFLVVDAQRRVQGFLGWAFTQERLAERWVESRASLTDEDCREGDCVIINAWAASSTAAHRLLIDEGLKLFARKLRIYARRYNIRGRPRPLRIGGHEAADKFAAMMRAVANVQDENATRRQDA